MEARPKVQETYAKREAGAGDPHFFSREGTAWLESVHARVKDEGILEVTASFANFLGHRSIH
jgi:hypothetical protein